MPGFYMECYTGLKWVKREYLLPLILSLVYQNVSKEVLLTEPKIQAKVPSLLQNATVITKCDVYYKLRQYSEVV